LDIVIKIWDPLRKLFAPLVSQAGYGPELIADKGIQGRNEGGTIPRAPNHYGGVESLWGLRGAPKSPNNVTNTFFDTVHLLPKELRFEHGGAKFVACLGRHLISLRPWMHMIVITFSLQLMNSRANPPFLQLIV